MLVNKGYLKRETTETRPKVRYFAIDTWPPEKLFLKDRIDLAYFASYYFRHYLQQWITAEMKQLEAKKNIRRRTTGNSPEHWSWKNDWKQSNSELRIPSAGDLTERDRERGPSLADESPANPVFIQSF